MSSTMGTWMSHPGPTPTLAGLVHATRPRPRPARPRSGHGSCWPCWPNRTGSRPCPRWSWVPRPCPRWPSGPGWSPRRRPGRSAGWWPAACWRARAARATGSAPTSCGRRRSRRRSGPPPPDADAPDPNPSVPGPPVGERIPAMSGGVLVRPPPTGRRRTRCCGGSCTTGGCWPCRPPTASAGSCSTTWPGCSSRGGATPSRRSTSCSGATTPTTPCSAATWSTTASSTAPTSRRRPGRARSRSTGARAAPSTLPRLLLPEALAGLGEGGGEGVAQRPGGLLGLLPELRVADGVAEGAERLLQRLGQLLQGVVDLAPVGGRRGPLVPGRLGAALARLACRACRACFARRPGLLLVVLLDLAPELPELLTDLVPGRLALSHLRSFPPTQLTRAERSGGGATQAPPGQGRADQQGRAGRDPAELPGLAEVVAVRRVPDDAAVGQAEPVGLGGGEGPAAGGEHLGHPPVRPVGRERRHLPAAHHGAGHDQVPLGHQLLDVPAQPLEGGVQPVVGGLERGRPAAPGRRRLADRLVVAGVGMDDRRRLGVVPALHQQQAPPGQVVGGRGGAGVHLLVSPSLLDFSYKEVLPDWLALSRPAPTTTPAGPPPPGAPRSAWSRPRTGCCWSAGTPAWPWPTWRPRPASRSPCSTRCSGPSGGWSSGSTTCCWPATSTRCRSPSGPPCGRLSPTPTPEASWPATRPCPGPWPSGPAL